MAAAGRESPISGQPVRDPPRRPPRDGNGCRPGPVSVRDGGETSGVPAAAARSWPQAQPAARGEPRSPDPGSGGARPERRSLGSEPGGAGPAPDARFRGWALLVGPKNRVRVEPEPVCGRCRRPMTPTLPASRGGNGAGGEGSPAFPLGVSVDFVLRGRKATGEFCRKMAGLAPSPQPRTSPSPSNRRPSTSRGLSGTCAHASCTLPLRAHTPPHPRVCWLSAGSPGTTCSPVRLLFHIQVTASMCTRILFFDMKENGKEGRNTVRNCGLFPRLPPCTDSPCPRGAWTGRWHWEPSAWAPTLPLTGAQAGLFPAAFFKAHQTRHPGALQQHQGPGRPLAEQPSHRLWGNLAGEDPT